MRINRRWFAAAVFAVVAGAAGVTLTGTANAESNGGVRVMPLGDSITEGTQVPGGYRIGLWQRLATGGYRIDFVGSQYNGPTNLGDHDHEGHTGWRIDQIDANITGWLATYQPHSILLHIGTNDILQNYNVSTAPNRLSTLIDHITTATPNAEVFVAQIIPLANSGQENAVRTFNNAIPGIVQTKTNAGKHVHLVDMHSALTTADLTDGIHPTATGYDKMANVWYNALRSVPGSIGNNGSPTPSPSRSSASPSPSPSRSASPSPSPSLSTSPSPSPSLSTSPSPSPSQGAGGCSATYAIANFWPGGFQGSVRVTAGSSAIHGWTVTWHYANGQSINQAWSATVTSAGADITARNVDYNGAVAAAATVEFGFLANAPGTNEVPALSCSAT
jgi:lysophospholipase L1-like esterase